MQALVFRDAGEPASVLTCAEMAAPVAGDGTVLVKVAARPIHPADLAFIRGQYRLKPSFPQVAGLEGVGTVLHNPQGAAFAVGTRVAFRCPGAWADIAAVPADRLIAVPDSVSDEAACQISLNPLTAIGLLAEAAVGAGDWILLTAATSTVSSLVTAIAQTRGIRVIGLVRGNAVEARMRARAEQILSVADPDLAAAVHTATGGRGVAALLDSVGGPILPNLFATLTPGARIVAYGVQDRAPAAVTNAMLIYANLTWKGFGIDRWLAQTPTESRDRFVHELWTLISEGALPLPVASRHALPDFRSALSADATPGRNGKVLLVS